MARAPMGPTKPDAGCDRRQARDGAGDNPDEGGFSVLDPIDKQPCQRGRGGRDVGHRHCHASVGVGRQGAAGVEAEPADPQHGRAGHRHAWAVRRPDICWKALAVAEHQRDDDRRHAGGLMHDKATGEVHHPKIGEPAAAPHPVCDRGVYDEKPQGTEQEHGGELLPLRIGADDERRRDDREGHLEHEEDSLGDVTVQGVEADAAEKCLAETADPLVGTSTVAEGEAIADDKPQDRG